MFKRARRRIEKSEKDHNLSLTPEVEEELGSNTDDTESISESDSESSGSESPSRKRKRPLKDVGEDGDAGESSSRGSASEGEEEEHNEPNEGGVDDEMGAEGGPTIDSALKDPLFFVSDDQQACAVCPGKLLKNQHMVALHMGATHHIRRFARFKQTAERLSTRFDDISSDFASNIVRVMDSVQQSKRRATSHKPSETSKRALKKQKLAFMRGRQHKKKRPNSNDEENRTPQAKETIHGPKSLKKRKLETVEARSMPSPRLSPPSSASKPARSSKSMNGRRSKAAKA